LHSYGEGVLIGFGLPVAGAWATPGNVARFAARAEELGYGSLWTFQRLLVPENEQVQPVYRAVLDPLIALTYAAAHTTRARLGVAIVNLPFVSPTVLAKQAATLDVLSDGRLDLGLGTGWSAAEFIATGASMDRRGKRAEEYAAVLHALWTDEISHFDGEFYTVPPSSMAPKPVQRPGGAAPRGPHRRRLDQPQRPRPDRDRRGHRRGEARRAGRGQGPRPGTRRLPRRRAPRRARPPPVGQLRRHPR
jgi:alkanesulfonate monooxygenase SsuD/methylene tetrahydromethanopterin reductase-like flavin-dependent oxidoreductase (luciferase family)